MAYYIGNVQITQETLNKINALMDSDQKLAAIKYVREISGLGLADTKTWVENYKSYDLNQRQSFDSQVSSQTNSGVDNKKPDNIEDIKSLASKGDAQAQYLFADWIESLDEDDDEYEEYDDEDVFENYRKSALQGYGPAMYELAECYYYGTGTEENNQESLKWLKKAEKELLKHLDDFEHRDSLGGTYSSLSHIYSGYCDDIEKNGDLSEKYRLKCAEYWWNTSREIAEEFLQTEDLPQALYWFENTARLLEEQKVQYSDEWDDSDESRLSSIYEKIDELKKVVPSPIKKNTTSQKKTPSNKAKKVATFDVLFPTTYGNTRFTSMDDVESQKDSNPDALGFYSQCSIFGAGTSKKGNNALEGLFSAANEKCSDAILFLGRMYEYGMTFIRQDEKQALNLYKYAYSLENIDALHSLGYILYNFFDKKSIGLSIMKKSAELGSRGARFHLNLLSSQIEGIEICRFEDIPEAEFAFSKPEALRSISLYDVDLSNPTAIKSALLNIMNNMKPQTFSVIMNEFRMKHLRGRELFHFENVDFRGIFDSLVSDGVIEAGGVGDFGVTENTLYISRESTQKMKTTILDGDDWDI